MVNHSCVSCSWASLSYKQAYGVDVRIGWNPDSLGITGNCRRSTRRRHRLLRHAEDDVERHQSVAVQAVLVAVARRLKVLAYFPRRLRQSAICAPLLSDDLDGARQRSTGMTDMMDLYGVGDHGGGPTRAMLDEACTGRPHAASVAADGGGPVTPKYEFGTAPS